MLTEGENYPLIILEQPPFFLSLRKQLDIEIIDISFLHISIMKEMLVSTVLKMYLHTCQHCHQTESRNHVFCIFKPYKPLSVPTAEQNVPDCTSLVNMKGSDFWLAFLLKVE